MTATSAAPAPHLSEDLLTLASGGLAVLVYPNHPWSTQVSRLAQTLSDEILV